MWERHGGKMRPWFIDTTCWSIVTLEAADLADLVFLESDWTKGERLVVPGGLNYRLLDQVVQNAKTIDYFASPSTDDRLKVYYRALTSGSLCLHGEDRVVVCSAEDCEMARNPRGRYYLLDGVGRCLPYLLLMTEKAIEYVPVEAFLAER